MTLKVQKLKKIKINNKIRLNQIGNRIQMMKINHKFIQKDLRNYQLIILRNKIFK